MAVVDSIPDDSIACFFGHDGDPILGDWAFIYWANQHVVAVRLRFEFTPFTGRMFGFYSVGDESVVGDSGLFERYYPALFAS